MKIDEPTTTTLIPPGAVLQNATWHIAHYYGPGDAFPTERDALRAGIARYEEREARRKREWETRRTFGTREPVPFALTIDLRWRMRWEPGSPDANGRPTASSGTEFTVRRVTYESLDDARAHLDRIEKYAPVTP